MTGKVFHKVHMLQTMYLNLNNSQSLNPCNWTKLA